jgi:hypothetical protein
MIELGPVDRLRLQRGAEHQHRLGPRAIGEFLAEVGTRTGTMPWIINRLAEYETRITPDMLRATGGDRFPIRLRVVLR